MILNQGARLLRGKRAASYNGYVVRRLFIGTLITLALAAFVYPRPIPPNSAAKAPDRSFSVVSLNMAKEGDPKKVVQSLERAPRLQDADLYLFQEVRQDSGKPSVRTVPKVPLVRS